MAETAKRGVSRRFMARILFYALPKSKIKNPYLPDQKLVARVVDFREADMPIYLADYQALKQEISRIATQLEEPLKNSWEERTI